MRFFCGIANIFVGIFLFFDIHKEKRISPRSTLLLIAPINLLMNLGLPSVFEDLPLISLDLTLILPCSDRE
jgi:hypothetical protein